MTIEIQNEIFFRLLSIVLIAPLGVNAKTSAVQIMGGEIRAALATPFGGYHAG